MELIKNTVEATGASKTLNPRNILKEVTSAAANAAMVGMMNPVPAEGQEVREAPKPQDSYVFDGPTTQVSVHDSTFDYSTPVVQQGMEPQIETGPVPTELGMMSSNSMWTMQDLMARPHKIADVTWNTTQAIGVKLYEIFVPDGFMAAGIRNSQLMGAIRHHQFWRFSRIEFTAQYNTNPFMAGFLRMAYFPGYESIGIAFDQWEFNRALTANGVDLNASAMTQGTVVAPYTAPTPWLPTTPTPGNAWIPRLGSLKIFVNCPLIGPAGSTPTLHIRLLMQIHGLELAMPLPPHLYRQSTEILDENEIEGQSGPSSQELAEEMYERVLEIEEQLRLIVVTCNSWTNDSGRPLAQAVSSKLREVKVNNLQMKVKVKELCDHYLEVEKIGRAHV